MALSRERQYELRDQSMAHAVDLAKSRGADYATWSEALKSAQQIYDWLADTKHPEPPDPVLAAAPRAVRARVAKPPVRSRKPAPDKATPATPATPAVPATKTTPAVKAVPPVKRGPGRPRKVAPEAPALPDAPPERKSGDLGGALRGEYTPPPKPPTKRAPVRPRKTD